MRLERKHRGSNTKDEKGTVSILIYLRKGRHRVKGNILRQFSVQKIKVSEVLEKLKAVLDD